MTIPKTRLRRSAVRIEHVALRVIGVSGGDHFTLDAASDRGIFDARLAKPVTVAASSTLSLVHG